MVDLGSLYGNYYKEVADGSRSIRISQVLAQSMAQVYSISKVSGQLMGHTPAASKPFKASKPAI